MRVLVERLDAFVQSERGLRVLGIVALVVLVTGVASIGANGRDTSRATDLGPATGTAPPSADTATPVPGAKSTVTAPTGGATVTAPGGTARIPPSVLKGLDFGLKTQGVTAKTVKVGFSGNFDNCGDTAGLVQQFGPGLVGDPNKSFTAFERYVNDHGGVGGRKYDAILFQDGGSTCPERNLPAAVKMADQEKVFLAAPGLHVESDYIIKRKIPVWGGRDDPTSLRKYGPNGFALFEPIVPTLEAWAGFGKHYLKTTDKTGPNKACLIRIESGASGNWDYPERVLVDRMARLGIRFVDTYTFKDDPSTAQSQANAIAIKERDLGCEHVYFMAGNFVGLVFITDAATQNRWFPKKWTWTGYTALVDDDRFAKLMDQVQWENAVGLTYRLPRGEHPLDENCKRIYESYYSGDGQGESAYVKIACSAILSTAEIMRRGIKLTGKLDANAFVLGANAIRDNFYWDAHVPMDFRAESPSGPFKTRAFKHYTVADWSSAASAYEFPAYPCYYRTFGANNAGCEDLRKYYKK